MTLVIALLVQVLHLALLLAAAPLAAGLAHIVGARLADRAGAPLLQPWRDLRRLARKQGGWAEGTSGLFALAPALAFAASVVAAALVPAFARGMALAPLADTFVIAGLLLLARAVLALAALEGGTALGGLAAGDAMALAAATWPALLLALVCLALLAGTSNLDDMERVLRAGAAGVRLPLLLALAALLVVAAAQRDGPPAHDHSGRPLALLLWGGWLRRLVWLSLLGNLALPWGLADATGTPLSWLVGLLAWAAKVAVLAVGLALGQGARPARLCDVALAAVLLALLAAAFLLTGQGLA